MKCDFSRLLFQLHSLSLPPPFPPFLACVACPQRPCGTWGSSLACDSAFIEGQILAICLHVYSFSRQFQMHFVYRSSLNLPRHLPGESKREFIGFHPPLPCLPASPYKLFIKRSSQLAEIGCDAWEWASMAPPSGHARRWKSSAHSSSRLKHKHELSVMLL